jgi:hypothetical protein
VTGAGPEPQREDVEPTPEGADLPPRAQALADALTGWPRQRVVLTELWRLLDQVDPASGTDARRRSLLADALAALSAANRVTLPAKASWDRTERPALPRFVTVAATRPRGLREPKRVVWHPDLAWAGGSGFNLRQRAILAQVNRWLHTHRDESIVPVRERSLQVFGNEKTLDGLQRTVLFGPGRLSLDLLRARRAVPRLTTERVGPGDVLLVVENSDTFDTLVRVLSADPGDVGIVGWGAGGGFEASVLSVAWLPGPVRAIRYFGDLDRRGLEIPASASRLAVSEGLPPVEPDTTLYAALLDVGHRDGGRPALSQEQADTVAAWLPEPLAGQAAALLRQGVRLAQEAVGVEYFAARARR